ncbi:MAG TPA: DinB family protein [Streptosporangiaceae bacterium]|nr:DinB family protein [Streptosporangiaceae bacterium]
MDEEAELLLYFLNQQRNHVLGILDGLSETQLCQPVLPSGWHCLGMVKHLALADEHYWFRSVVGGESFDFFPEGPNAEWRLGPDETAEDVFNLYREEIERANAVIADTPLGMAPRQPDPRWAEWSIDFPNLRYIMLHMIKETACHAGHLDAVREILDGRQWIVM